jgi:hypothetical protein
MAGSGNRGEAFAQAGELLGIGLRAAALGAALIVGGLFLGATVANAQTPDPYILFESAVSRAGNAVAQVNGDAAAYNENIANAKDWANEASASAAKAVGAARECNASLVARYTALANSEKANAIAAINQANGWSGAEGAAYSQGATALADAQSASPQPAGAAATISNLQTQLDNAANSGHWKDGQAELADVEDIVKPGGSVDATLKQAQTELTQCNQRTSMTTGGSETEGSALAGWTGEGSGAATSTLVASQPASVGGVGPHAGTAPGSVPLVVTAAQHQVTFDPIAHDNPPFVIEPAPAGPGNTRGTNPWRSIGAGR